MPSKYEEMMRSKGFLPYSLDCMTPRVRQQARDELKETEETAGAALEKMREFIRGEKNFRCRTDDEFLHMFLRARKFDAKKAFVLLQNLYDVKRAYADMYEHLDFEAMRRVAGPGPAFCLPYRDADGCAVLVLQLCKWDPEVTNISIALTALTAILLRIAENPVTQVCGVRALVDVRGFTLRQMRSFTPRYIHLLSRALRNSLPIRFKGIHFFNETTIFQYVWSVLKIVLTEKIRKRIHFHGDNQKSLQKYIPKDILHAEYGGDNIYYDSTEWCLEELNKFLDTFQHIAELGYHK